MKQLFLTDLVVEIGLALACPREGLRTVRPQEARSIDGVKHGLQAFVTALRAAQDRRRTLEPNLATLNSDSVPGNRYRVTQTTKDR
jgi:hypothetical protein